MIFRSVSRFHIVLLWILIIGCYGSVQLNNGVEFLDRVMKRIADVL